MEKKKLLLVAVSVGVVLLIIIGIPLMMIAPRQNHGLTLESAVPSEVDRSWGVTIEPNSGYKAETPPPSFETVVEPPAYTSNVQPEENVVTQVAEVSQVTTITVPVPQTAAVPNTPTTTQAQRSAPVRLSSPASPPPAAKPAAPAAPKAEAKQPVQKPAAAPARTYDTYWVQTGAFSTKVRAEGAKESLAGKGIASIIDNRDIDGKTWYRVRVGPYMSETEANYWLALVKSIDGFSESQIRLTQASR